ncbi:MAG: hypothetical protein NVSMB4_06030 [Acidimicrobiales bacterium]
MKRTEDTVSAGMGTWLCIKTDLPVERCDCHMHHPTPEPRTVTVDADDLRAVLGSVHYAGDEHLRLRAALDRES